VSNPEDPQESWFEERQSSWLYRRIATREADPVKQRMFAALADAAERQALFWSGELARAGRQAPAFAPSRRAHIVAWLVDRRGPRAMRHALAAIKVRGVSVYQPELMTGGGHDSPANVKDVGGRHQGVSGGNLRAAVFGANDGLVSNASLIMGVAAAAGGEPKTVLITGVAGWLAGALSMAAGEYVSVRSQRDLYEYQIALERQELALYPEQEAEELALIYAARGMEPASALAFARQLTADPAQALTVLAREELGLNPDDLGAPFGAALTSFGSFSVGALVPLLPFLLGAGERALPWALGLTALALAGIGGALSLFTGRGAIGGALRMLLIGGGAGAISYALGALLGVAMA
jgi:VIT1/CCC1 family predicted Fe2+/Mn2+ transporter